MQAARQTSKTLGREHTKTSFTRFCELNAESKQTTQKRHNNVYLQRDFTKPKLRSSNEGIQPTSNVQKRENNETEQLKTTQKKRVSNWVLQNYMAPNQRIVETRTETHRMKTTNSHSDGSRTHLPLDLTKLHGTKTKTVRFRRRRRISPTGLYRPTWHRKTVKLGRRYTKQIFNSKEHRKHHGRTSILQVQYLDKEDRASESSRKEKTKPTVL